MNTVALKWDSDFFGFKTARILTPDLDEKQLIKTLENLRSRDIRLVYWASTAEADFDVSALGGRLVDKKAIFEANLAMSKPLSPISGTQVIPYTSAIPQPVMLDLALQAGQFSRYARDPQFPHERFNALYLEWMRKSLAGQMADEVLVAIVKDIPAGMVTLSAKDGIGEIGLIAVDSAYRGRHVGMALMAGAHNWYKENNLMLARVITQADNLPACGLYERCGYALARLEYFYHFWLEPEK
jgi:dTDP-4-amino-4,6-dideoxy-D-galactose acyltransferase